MKKLTTIGRILFAVPFGILGISHFVNSAYYFELLTKTSLIQGMGFSIFVVGLALIAASIAIIFNKLVPLACQMLAVLLGLFICAIHIPSIVAGNNMSIALIELMKDTSLLGAALFISGIYKKSDE